MYKFTSTYSPVDEQPRFSISIQPLIHLFQRHCWNFKDIRFCFFSSMWQNWWVVLNEF
ncbi:hypothetical protein HanPSC8_Chr12g0511721 [Helianthus annuus]|nr:hypothetical protein HanPSC8_Chr12g0511721 [Helianthus annuus]